MDNKKIIMNRANMLGVILSMIIFIGFVTGFYLIFSENMTQAEKSVDSRYTDFYTRVDNSQGNIEDKMYDMQKNLDSMKESDNPLIYTWNGLKGLGSSILLVKEFIVNGQALTEQSFNALPIIPNWIKALTVLTILSILVIVVYKVVKGEPGGMD
jgi:hypothetical protein